MTKPEKDKPVDIKAIINRLDLCAMMYDQFPEEIRERECVEAEKELNVLGLLDPVIASYIHDHTDYFPNKLEPGQLYIGHRVRINKVLLDELDTPEKRAQHIRNVYIRFWSDSVKTKINEAKKKNIHSGKPSQNN